MLRRATILLGVTRTSSSPLDRVATAEFRCLVRAHVAAADTRCPLQQLVAVFGDLGDSVQDDVRKRRVLVVHTQRQARLAPQVAPLDRARTRGEEEIAVVVELEPDRRHVGASVGGDGGELAGARAGAQKLPRFLSGHLFHVRSLLNRLVSASPAARRMNHSVPKDCSKNSGGMARKKEVSAIWLACAAIAERLGPR